MRNLQRNQRELHYAVPTGTEPILDEYGNDTLEVRTVYGAPIRLMASISANVGQESIEVFGSQTEYSRMVTVAGADCPLKEGCPVWFGSTTDKPNNYKVVKVADSKNGFLIALQEVSARG